MKSFKFQNTMQRFTKAIATIMLMTAVVLVAGCKKDNNNGGSNGGDVCVTTYTPQDITQTTARCGGDVIVTQSLSLDELGVCWSENKNPTVSDAHLSTKNCEEPFICTITSLEPGTEYHVRAYAMCDREYYYGDDKTFTTESNSGGGGGNNGGGNGTHNGHDYVDLGLPSGTLWATCNVGATMREDCGDYFAWGEIMRKTNYDWDTYKYWSDNALTKYCNNSEFGYNGFTDDLTVLQPIDDAAIVNWGNGWRIPTKEQWEELNNNTTNIWTTQNGVNGRLFTASNGTSLFLPVTGGYFGHWIEEANMTGSYWSSSLYTDRPDRAYDFGFRSDFCRVSYTSRFGGLCVRPVREN